MLSSYESLRRKKNAPFQNNSIRQACPQLRTAVSGGRFVSDLSADAGPDCHYGSVYL